MVSPEARLLQYFLAVAEALNFTRAAERLGIAQPALSAAVRQLESQLGVRLLERTTRSVALTDAGRALVEHGPAALAGLQDAWEAARAAGRGDAGTVRLVYGPSTAYETVPRLVDAVRDRLPGLAVSADMVPTPEVLRLVAEGKADAGVARLPRVADGLRTRLLRIERQGILVRADDPLARHEEVTMKAAADRPLLVHQRAANPAHYDVLLDALAAAGVRDPQLVERPVAFDPDRRLIREGRGIAVVGSSSVHDLAGDLRWIPFAEPAPRLEVALVVRDGPLTPATDRFERIAAATAARLGWLDP